MPKHSDGTLYITLIERGYILSRGKTVTWSAEHADHLTTDTNVHTFAQPAPTFSRTSTALTLDQSSRFSIQPELLEQSLRSLWDLYLSWVDDGVADEYRAALGDADRGNGFKLLTYLYKVRDKHGPRVDGAIQTHYDNAFSDGIEQPTLVALNLFCARTQNYGIRRSRLALGTTTSNTR